MDNDQNQAPANEEPVEVAELDDKSLEEASGGQEDIIVINNCNC